ncbi:hypothetical protein CKO42_11855 [Lamprobacter modestohalophilus]|uniref:Uncharacterized protein n=2 Tax=Lamprobacter modestohalophilus TaxID=1064514 RepID=A0A9X0W957_9GAMM|nr:hypothetical protein [Lamprobacter modestohalophilus]
MDLIAPSSNLYLPQWRSSRRVKIIRNRRFYPPLLLKISMQADALPTPQPHQITVRAFFFMGDADVLDPEAKIELIEGVTIDSRRSPRHTQDVPSG